MNPFLTTPLSRFSSRKMHRAQNNNASMDEVWLDLESGLGQVFKRVAMTPARYMELYTHVFNFCTSSTVPQQVDAGNVTPRRRNGNEPLSADFLGLDLYNKLSDFIKLYVSDVNKRGKDVVGEELLKFYTHEWTEFRFSSKVIDGIFAYLNRHWIKRERDEGNVTIYAIYIKALVIWRDEFFMHVKERVTDAVLELFRRDRSSETIERQLIRGVVDSYVELGIDNECDTTENPKSAESQAKPLEVYVLHFEQKFLSATDTFYANEAQVFVAQNPLTEYMKKVESRLEEEQERCELMLHKSTQSKLAKTLERVLIESLLESFQGEFCRLLENKKDEDLARMYKLCERVEKGLDNLRSSLEQYITREGLAAIDKVREKAQQDARLYISTVLGVHSRYWGLVEAAFRNEPGFVQSLDKAVTAFINKNSVTTTSGMGGAKSSELLAKYCDVLLRKSKKMPEESELEEMLNKVMIVFKYIEDKDIFSKYFTKTLSKRLITETSASEDAEISLINKLKQSCGFEYTNKMSKMINDVQISKTTSSEYQAKARENGKAAVDFQILVLSTGSWPTMGVGSFLLPGPMATCVEEFKKYYDERHNGRKLSWALAQSRGEVVCNAFSSMKIFMASTAQMSVLMLFNDAVEYDIQSIQENLKMDKRVASATVMSLIKAEVVCGPTMPSSGEYEGTVKVELNMKFTNPKVKVDLTKSQIRADPKQENEQVQKDADEDRKAVINACIVRIMKMRKTLQHTQLMTEVLQQLSHRFKPKIELIKRCIGQLIEKEYIKRSETQREVYEYIS